MRFGFIHNLKNSEVGENMEEKIFGYDKEDWDRWQREHAEWQGSLGGLEMVPLWPKGTPGYVPEYGQQEPKLCLLPKQEMTRGTVLICAGGGYHMKSVFEGRMVAQKYHDFGFNAAVLDYRCKPYSTWQALDDAQRAIKLLRFHAGEWNLDPEHIAVGGFSAGGHLSSMAGTQYTQANELVRDETDAVSCRPNAVIQCYGALNYETAGRLMGEGTEEEAKRFCPDRNVTGDTPPFFMWMTGQDDVIPRKGLYEMAQSLEAAGVSYELHLFPRGIHGVSLADGSSKFGKNDPHTASWMRLSCEWLEELGF